MSNMQAIDRATVTIWTVTVDSENDFRTLVFTSWSTAKTAQLDLYRESDLELLDTGLDQIDDGAGTITLIQEHQVALPAINVLDKATALLAEWDARPDSTDQTAKEAEADADHRETLAEQAIALLRTLSGKTN
jgi:hypothetical protein